MKYGYTSEFFRERLSKSTTKERGIYGITGANDGSDAASDICA